METRRGEANPPSVRFAPDIIPDAHSSKTGVSVRYVPDKNKSWYVFRASYGREFKASDCIVHLTAVDGCENLPKFDRIFDRPFSGLYLIRGGEIFQKWEDDLRKDHFLE